MTREQGVRVQAGGDTRIETDTRVALAAIAAYFALSLALLPTTEYARALGLATIIFACIAGLARWLGRGYVGLSFLVVAFATGALLAMPTFPAMGGTGGRASVLAFLGMQAAALLWAALRWPPHEPRATRTSLGASLRFAALMATGFSAIASIPLGLMLLSGQGPGPVMLLVYPAYFAGFAAAAICFWLVRRIAHLATGRYLVGILGGTCVYLAVSPVVALAERTKVFSLDSLGIALIAGGIVGPAVALNNSGRTTLTE